MPVDIRAELAPSSPEEFAQLAYELMACVFDVHNEIGRFFEEKIYKREIARRFGGIDLEVLTCPHFLYQEL